MFNYLMKRKTTFEEPSNVNISDSQPYAKKDRVELNIDDLPSDHGSQKEISDYDPNERKRVEGHICQKVHVNLTSIIFHKRKLVMHYVILIPHGSKIMVIGWNIA